MILKNIRILESLLIIFETLVVFLTYYYKNNFSVSNLIHLHILMLCDILFNNWFFSNFCQKNLELPTFMQENENLRQQVNNTFFSILGVHIEKNCHLNRPIFLCQ